MTKAQFSRVIKAMLASVISIPDELWTTTFPALSVRLGEKEAYIGLRPVTPNYDKAAGDDYDD